MSRRPRALLDALAACAVAAAVYLLFGHAFLNYDSAYALAWGADLAHGRTPQYDLPVAPTPHPLLIALGALLAPLGAGAETVVLVLVLLAIGALAVALHRLGTALYAWPVGLLAAVIFVTRVPPLNFGIRGYVDLPAIALVAWAAVLEARRARRGAPVLVLLAVAGLLRPEAWLYAGAYWLWLALPGRHDTAARARAARLLPLALAAPLVWALSDLLVTGDPLWSLHGTSRLAAELERPTGLGAVPEIAPRRLGEILRLPELLAAVGGAAAGLWWLRRRTLLPLAVAGSNGLAYLGFAVAGLPLLGRYLFLAAAMLSVLAAVGVFGWTALPRGHRARGRWRGAGAVALVAIVVFAPQQAGRIADLRADIGARDRVQDDLHALARDPAARAALGRCRPLLLPNHRNVPSLALWLDRSPGEIRSARLTQPPRDGAFIAPGNPEVERLSVLDPRDPARFSAAPPPGYRERARNRSWVLLTGC